MNTRLGQVILVCDSGVHGENCPAEKDSKTMRTIYSSILCLGTSSMRFVKFTPSRVLPDRETEFSLQGTSEGMREKILSSFVFVAPRNVSWWPRCTSSNANNPRTPIEPGVQKALSSSSAPPRAFGCYLSKGIQLQKYPNPLGGPTLRARSKVDTQGTNYSVSRPASSKSEPPRSQACLFLIDGMLPNFDLTLQRVTCSIYVACENSVSVEKTDALQRWP